MIHFPAWSVLASHLHLLEKDVLFAGKSENHLHETSTFTSEIEGDRQDRICLHTGSPSAVWHLIGEFQL